VYGLASTQGRLRYDHSSSVCRRRQDELTVLDEELVVGVGATEVDSPHGFDHQAIQLDVVGIADWLLGRSGDR